MFITVKLLNDCPGFFTYEIPKNYSKTVSVGSLVQVPFRNKIKLAVVKTIQLKINHQISYTIKSIITEDFLPEDKHYLSFISKLSDYYCLDRFEIFKRLKGFLEKNKIESQEFEDSVFDNSGDKSITLTEKQQKIVEQIKINLINPTYYPILLQGVTGSGKTEVYKNLIEENFKLGKTTLLILPEVSLAVQFTYLLKKQLSNLEHLIFGFHSAISSKEKKLIWQNLLASKPLLIIGVHLPILLPINGLGLIIVDEEHEAGFQEKKHPKINTKEAALIRAQIYDIPILLGSATPSVSSLYQVEQKKWHFAQLTERFLGNFPEPKLVNLLDPSDKIKRKNFWISSELEKEIKSCLERKEQIILFLNRRGFSFFIQCKNCGYIFLCPSCSVSLTVHENNQTKHKIIKCHYCDFKQNEPKTCSECNANESSLLKKGLGTQQLVLIVQQLFPNAIIDRADLDSTVNKKKWRETIEKFSCGKIDILIGTQTITKGYHFPKVTLVGIIWADLNLGLPVYTATEVTLQQLIQVSGRAGRLIENSKVIVQTMINHPIYEFLGETNYSKFYNSEIAKRKLTSYPPCVRLAEIDLKYYQESVLEEESQKLFKFLSYFINQQKLSVKLLGPTQPPVYKIKNMFSRKIFMKSNTINNLTTLFKEIDRKKYKSSIFFTPNPQSF
jgi:primosomal protein N' (replication factor Y) (superfamily II helicase)